MDAALSTRIRAAERSTIAWLEATFERVLDVVFPWECRGCGAPDRFLCEDCTARIRWIREPCCERCGIPFASGPTHVCGHCRNHPPRFERARSAAIYGGDGEDRDPLGAAIRALKYGRRRALAGPLSVLLADRTPYVRKDCDVVVPVPLHRSRLRERGFNQALLLARGPARRLGVPLAATMISRVVPTVPQTTLDEAGRRRNVRDAFRVNRPADVDGKRVLLVDDVITSGATVDACARALLEAGAAAVSVASLGRAVFR